ncbi:hypothetical protein ACFPN1_09155 [Lysobacter yangpyeongensis]|uniref:Uncharacterized protein n=1 Tax=Lysobacter yangpyeongensis TaxID=346182 RepID=A0ABW0SMT5_9GAMM
MRESLRDVPNYATACVAEYRHAVEFRADGHLYQVLLCYHCGQLAVLIDGQSDGDEQTYNMGDEKALDAILRAAGVRLAPKSE